ncbi:MAG: (2Fe-2S)-binding protein [Proteobacteria bacterium]|nr:(2Fe-2S)-binding protein [Pseudomonadota bacterium]
MARYILNINGEQREVQAEPNMPLLYALRGELELKGPKFGCGLGQCGACTVIIDGAAIRSCVTPVSAISAKSIRTIDKLGTEDAPHPVQKAFIEEQATQCGYCTNGWIMTTVAALEHNSDVSNQDIREFLSGLKCRCGSHMSMLRAVRRAADIMSEDNES